VQTARADCVAQSLVRSDLLQRLSRRPLRRVPRRALPSGAGRARGRHPVILTSLRSRQPPSPLDDCTGLSRIDLAPRSLELSVRWADRKPGCHAPRLQRPLRQIARGPAGRVAAPPARSAARPELPLPPRRGPGQYRAARRPLVQLRGPRSVWPTRAANTSPDA
jgi:hypothetical protein